MKRYRVAGFVVGAVLLGACEPLPGAGPAGSAPEDEGVRAYSLRGVSPAKPRAEYQIVRSEEGGFEVVRADKVPDAPRDDVEAPAPLAEADSASENAPVSDGASAPGEAQDVSAKAETPEPASEKPVFQRSSTDDAPPSASASAPSASPAAPPPSVPPPSAPPALSTPAAPAPALGEATKRRSDPLRKKAGDVVLDARGLPSYWDGDETTGGLWIALPNLRAQQRVVITNPETGQQVVAKLFWRDPSAEGGSTLLSSQAASALGVGEGQVADLDVKIIKAE